jgi:hypothetical protein
MEKELNIINFDYLEVKKPFKFTSILLIVIFVFNPLCDFIDIFRREIYYSMCCILPCRNPFNGYFFI